MSDNQVSRGNSQILAYILLSVTAALCVLAGVLAFFYGLYIMYIIGGLAALAGVRFGVMPILSAGADLADQIAETYIRIAEHREAVKQNRQFVQIAPDEYGNYPQIIDRHSGQIISRLAPGNGQFKQIAAPRYYDDQDAIEAEIIPEVPELPAPAGIDPATATAPTFAEEISQGDIQPGDGGFTFCYRLAFDPFNRVYKLEAIRDAHEVTMFLVGWSTAGKSSLIAGAMAKRAIAGDTAILLLDPHKGNQERSITSKILPALNDWLIVPPNGVRVTGKKPGELRAAVAFLKNLLEVRLYRDDLTEDEKQKLDPCYGLKIWVVIDECLSYARETRIAGHDPVYDELTALMQLIATETAKCGITGVFMTQLSTKDQLGNMEIRDACPVQVVLKSPKDQGAALGLLAAEAKMADQLPKGRGYIKTMNSSNGYELFLWGYGSPEDIAAAVQGLASPLIPSWKQTGNRVISLASRGENRLHQSPDFYDGKTQEIGRKPDTENLYPAALQEALDRIPDWQNKLDTLRQIIGADQGEIWQALFNKAPGGRNHGVLKQEYDVLAEAIRYEYQQLRQGRRA